MDTQTRRKHARFDWISHRKYDMGIMRFGRVYIPAWWLVLPYILTTVGFALWWLISGAGTGEVGTWMPFAGVAGFGALFGIIRGARPVMEAIRDASYEARNWAESKSR